MPSTKIKDNPMTRLLPTVAITSALIVSAAAISAPAYAESETTQTVTLTYDLEELKSPIGAIDVLEDLERQAREACVTVVPLIRTESVDNDCVSGVLTQAISRIDNAQLTTAYEQADGLASRLSDDTKSEG